jgi:hypothetical protein
LPTENSEGYEHNKHPPYFHNSFASYRALKTRATSIYEAWKIKVKPLLTSLEIDSNVLDVLDALFGDTYSEAKSRVGDVTSLRNTLGELHDAFLNKVVIPLNSGQTVEPTLCIMESASFLGLDTNWSVVVCALQLQEVAITLVAKKIEVNLDKAGVDKILKRQIQPEDFSFSHQYEAFGIEVKRLFGIDMPILLPQFRRMRVKVLHEGYNPEPEEKDSLVSFTTGLLRKLEDICSKI